MKFSLRALAPVIGIPAGFLPLLAMVETGPAEVAVTLFLLTVFGLSEAIGAARAEHEARWMRWTWSAAKIAFAYGFCLVVGLVVGVAVARIANAEVRSTPLQRWLFGEPGFLDLTPLFVRYFLREMVMNSIPSGAVLHEERGSVAMPTNAASNQFVTILQNQAKQATGASTSPQTQISNIVAAPTTTTPAP